MTYLFKKYKIIKQSLKETYKDFLLNMKLAAISISANAETDFANLRICCHMLDKGLNNPDFKPGHSLKVYKKAVLLVRKLEKDFFGDAAFCWAKNIINRFQEAQKEGMPILNNQQEKHFSSEEQILIKNFILSRTSCRHFIKKEIPLEVLNDVVNIAIDAPNGCCRQTTRYYISQNEEIVKAVIPNIAGITNFSNIQGLVAVCSESSFYQVIDKNLRFVDASLSAENFILAARMYGVYGTMCNFFHASSKENEKCKQLMQIKDSETIVMFIAIGYPKTIPEKPARRNLENFYRII